MGRDTLKRELTEHFQQSLDQAMDAVERAPDGAWISASEWQVRGLFPELTARAFGRILQAKLDAAEPAAFSPPGAKPGHRTRGCAAWTCSAPAVKCASSVNTIGAKAAASVRPTHWWAWGGRT